jgi:hypothetical protein
MMRHKHIRLDQEKIDRVTVSEIFDRILFNSLNMEPACPFWDRMILQSWR